MWSKELIQRAENIVNEIYSKNENVTPKKVDALNFFKIDLEKIKVVILGQDPYPTEGVANGFAFAVNPGTPTPQSLKNIYKELTSNFGEVHTDDTLSHWVKQGVLLLNTSLTTIVGQPAAHSKIWKNFTTDLIEFIDENNKNIVWVLWGNHAISYTKNIKNGIVVKDAHPSPLSVRHRSGKSFLEINKHVDIKW